MLHIQSGITKKKYIKPSSNAGHMFLVSGDLGESALDEINFVVD
jgi:hypothetical protein